LHGVNSTEQGVCVNVNQWEVDLGASVIAERGVRFKVWAPRAEELSVKTWSGGGACEIPLFKDTTGYFEGIADRMKEGDRYLYVLDHRAEYPDPASRFQPEGVHAPSQVIDPSAFQWEDHGWKGVELTDFIMYEVHVGTFTKEGTFEAIIPFLPYLRELGVTAVELMPVAQFPGTRNWGYDGTYPYAPQHSYGGPDGLKALINACHKEGLSVILDVVHNHLGPEGNYFANFGPYFTNRYRTPWGDAINFDGPLSDGVRHFFISNALYWITEYHVDALRLDAVHGMFDFGARHFLQELGEAVHGQAKALGRNIYVVVESDLNDVRVINPIEFGGYGLDAQWNDDFHHALHTLLTGETQGYYQDFGELRHLEKALREGFVYSGQFSQYRMRRHGSPSKERPAHQFVIFSQNHDQVGNRLMGDRLCASQPIEKLKVTAAMVLLSPVIPLLFMGEEYGEPAPFLYFVNHSDPDLIEAVRRGRIEEFTAFRWQGEPADPQAESTFLRSKIDVELRHQGRHRQLFDFYRTLLSLRKSVPSLRTMSMEKTEITRFDDQKLLAVRRWEGADQTLCLFGFDELTATLHLPLPQGEWEVILDSASPRWGGAGESAFAVSAKQGGDVDVQFQGPGVVVYRLRCGKV
jgi:maltooligosyltrehalose trehalohydrolase